MSATSATADDPSASTGWPPSPRDARVLRGDPLLVVPIISIRCGGRAPGHQVGASVTSRFHLVSLRRKDENSPASSRPACLRLLASSSARSIRRDAARVGCLCRLGPPMGVSRCGWSWLSLSRGLPFCSRPVSWLAAVYQVAITPLGVARPGQAGRVKRSAASSDLVLLVWLSVSTLANLGTRSAACSWNEAAHNEQDSRCA